MKLHKRMDTSPTALLRFIGSLLWVEVSIQLQMGSDMVVTVPQS